MPNSQRPTAPSPAVLRPEHPHPCGSGPERCEAAAVAVRNSGGTAARSGTATLGTHIIGLLGIDWSTTRSTEPLDPDRPDSRKNATWTVGVDDWRVPPSGMHTETRIVTVGWS